MKTLERCRAAMYASLGKQCQMSARGYTVIFAPEYRLAGRADLSNYEPLAQNQMAYAELEHLSVTDEQLEAYRLWQGESDARHLHDNARILVTAPKGERQGDKHNSIELQVGSSPVFVSAVKCHEVWDPEAINLVGRKGAFRTKPDSERIRKEVARMKREHPEFAHAPTVNNAGAEL